MAKGLKKLQNILDTSEVKKEVEKDPKWRNIRRVEDILKLVNDGITKVEFTTAFKAVVEFVQKIKDTNDVALKNIKREAEEALRGAVKNLLTVHAEKLEIISKSLGVEASKALVKEVELSISEASSTIAEQKKTTQDVKETMLDFVKTHKKATKEQEDGMNFLRDKVRNLTDGEDADEDAILERLLEKIPEQTEKFDATELVETLEKQRQEIEELKKRPVGGGVTNMRIQQAFKYILKTEKPVGAVDGSNLIYTVSQPIFAILAFSMNKAVIAQIPNYTINGNKITFTTALPTSYSGKDFECKYI